MELIKQRKTDFNFEDKRGTLVQLVRRGFSQINVISSVAGASRGGHFHKMNTEAFYIIDGKCRVFAALDGRKEEKEFTAGDFFQIAPYVRHSFQFLEDTILVSMYSLGVELQEGLVDIYEEMNHG